MNCSSPKSSIFRSLTQWRILCHFGLLLHLLLTSSALQAAEDLYPFQDPAKKSLFTQMISEFRCLVCQNQSLADSNAPLAQDLRGDLYRMVREGKTPGEITGFLVDRYGEFVLYRPPVQNNTVLLWFGPGIILLLGFAILYFVIKKPGDAP